MRYISTRGEAPPLGFIDVTLAGLARDGGLYVPESWPQIPPETIAGFAGRPYAEVAVEVIRPFVGGAISDADLSRMAREAYGTFRHPAVVPVSQLGANTFMLELFHGPTLAFKDVAMQLLARLMDHALAARNERTTVVVATHDQYLVDRFHHRGRNRLGLHLRGQIVRRHAIAGQEHPTLAGKRLLDAPVEEVGHMRVLLRLRNMQLPQSRSGDQPRKRRDDRLREDRLHERKPII